MSDQNLIFDVPCRANTGTKPAKTLSNSFIGRLVLTSDRLLFLSSGKTGALESTMNAVIFGGAAATLMCGSIEHSTAENLDLSALQNKGSWQLPLPRVSACEAKGSTFGALWFAWLGPRLLIRGQDDSGIPLSFCAFRGGIKGKNKNQLCQLIDDAVRAGK